MRIARHSKRSSRVVVTLALWLLAGVVLLGQSTNQGSIVGTVSDATGGVLPAAQVTVKNIATGATRETITNDRGDYRVDFLIPGTYNLTVQMPGFKTTELTDLTLQVGQVMRADARLEIGEMNQSIEVTGAAPTVNTETTAIGEVIDTTKIQNLPLNGREFIGLAALVPGAEEGSPKRGVVSSKGYAIGVNGARSMYNSYNLDGADSTDANYNQLISSPALDAIKEFRVETNMYSAQYGRSGGAVISVVTNSGSNEFHGSLYEYHRNKALDARPYFYAGAKENQPGYLFNQFGGSVGGPIFKDKTFFFFSAELFRQKKPGQNMVTFAPTEKEKVGDLTETYNIFTPTEKVKLRNPYTGELIPSNIVPPNLIDPVGQKLMDIWAENKPNFDDPFLNLHFMRAGTFNQDKWLARIDHNFTPKDMLFGTFNFGDYDNTSPYHTKYGDTVGLDHDRTLGLTYTKVLSTNLVNDLKFSHTWYYTGSNFALTDKNYAKEWGIWSGERTSQGGSPRLLMYTVGYQRFDIGTAGVNVRDNKNAYLKDTAAWVRGNHRLMVGGDWKRQAYDWLYEGVPPVGALYFGLYEGYAPQANNFNMTGSAFSSLLMAVSGRQDYGLGGGEFLNLRRNMFAVFVQDDWKVRPTLTLNLGLRYDYEQPFAEATNRFVTFNLEKSMFQYAEGAPNLDKVTFPYLTGGPNRPYDPSTRNFAPRVGLAWRPFNDNRTVIRGGYGMFFTSENAFTTVYGAWVPPFSGNVSYYPRATFQPDKVDHVFPLSQKPDNFTEIVKSPPTAYVNAREYPTGYMQQWNLAIGRELVSKLAIEIGYVGTKGTNLNSASSLSTYDYNAYLRTKDIYGTLISPPMRTKGNNSKYHSMQLKLKKDFSQGLNLLGAFTWGHSLAESSNDDVNENALTDSSLAGERIVQRRYSNADFDVRKRFVLSGGYEIPFGHGKPIGAQWNPVVDAILGGWQGHWIMTFSDGYPWTVYTSAVRFPDRIRDGNLPEDQRTVTKWYDYEAFPTHSGTTIPDPNDPTKTITVNLQGNAAANIIFGPGQKNLDLGIQKNFNVTEQARAQLRFEFFNITNHPSFIGPSGTYFFNSSSGARITRARENRDIQVALKILF
ncbi:MAG: TonB-dependent receptor domain-containing protein [Acidobacteriota bacterium]